MIIRTAVVKYQWLLTPCIAIINETHYYGFPVIDIAFGWLIWQTKIQIGVRKVKFEEDAA